jgi:hypothetical protein
MDPYRVSKRNELMGIWRDCMGYGYGVELHGDFFRKSWPPDLSPLCARWYGGEFLTWDLVCVHGLDGMGRDWTVE